MAIDHLQFHHYEVDGLYIKLDKKLILKATTIKIPKPKKRPNFDNIDDVLDRIKYLLTFFHYIELEKVNFKDNHYKIIYADNILYIASDDYEIAGNVWRKGRMLLGDISLFYIKKEHINMVATFTYDLYHDKLLLKGHYDAYGIKGRFQALKEKHDLSFILNSERFTDIKRVADKLPMKKRLHRWITEKIQAKEYRLYSLSGKGNVHQNLFTPDFHSFKADALLNEVKIAYKEGLSPVTVKKMLLHYEKETLTFKPTNPRYENRNIEVVKASISNISKGKVAKLNLEIMVETEIDKTIQKILNAYHLSIPVTFKQGKAKVALKLGVPLKKMPKRNIDIVVNVALGKGNIYLKKMKLPVTGGKIHYEKGVVTLKEIKLKAPWYEGVINGKVERRKKEANLLVFAKKIAVGKEKKKFFLLSDKKIPLHIYYDKQLRMVLPTYKIRVEQSSQYTQIFFEDIQKVKPFFRQFSLDFDGGNMVLRTKDFKNYTFKGTLFREACFLYSNKICYRQVPCSGSFNSKNIDFYAFKKQFHYSTAQSQITLKNLNIDLEKFLNSKKGLTEEKTKVKSSGKLKIKGINSTLRYDKYTLLTQRYTADIFFPSGTINAKGKLGTDVITFKKKGRYISIEALRIHDKMLHPLINFTGLQNGRYTIKISGTPKNFMKGEILLEGGMLKSFTAYNKTRKFIQKNRELSRMPDTGLGVKGFKIKEGKILYRIVKEKVIFDSVYIRGESATIVGKGELNLKNKKLHITLAIQTVRKLGKLIGSLPVLGYILMGEDNSITFALKLTGTLDNPKVETSPAKEILMLPFDLIKRTLQSPAHIINTK